MKNLISIIIPMIVMAITASSFSGPAVDDRKLDSLRSLFSNAPDGVDYIMSLYDSVDVVVLGERDHRDTTQYDFINRLVSDPRFIEKVGYIYTEVGTVNTAPICERTVTADYRDLLEFRDSALSLMRNEDFYPLWDKYNRYQFLENLYRLNSTLPKDQKVILRGTDVAFDWYECNDVESYRRFLAEKVNCGSSRDSMMADNFLTMFGTQPMRGGYHKALLITNTPHAIKDPANLSEGYLLSRELGDNMSVVLINWTRWWEHGDDLLRPWLYGLPDSAFVASGRFDCGFNLAGSPLADAGYCNSTAYNVSEYADGMVYYLDPGRFVMACGVPGIVSEDFLPELVRRSDIYCKSDGREEALTPYQLSDYYNTKRIFTPYANAWSGVEEISETGCLDMGVKDAAILMLKAIANGVSVFKLAEIEEDYIIEEDCISTALYGAEIISIGEPIPYAGGEGFKVPCELKLKNGSILQKPLCLRKNDRGGWYFDGGL